MNIKYNNLIKINKKHFILIIEYYLKNKSNKNDLINNILIDLDYYKYNKLNKLDAYIIRNIIYDQIIKL